PGSRVPWCSKPFKDEPLRGGATRAIPDCFCARRRQRSAVGARESLRRGRTREMAVENVPSQDGSARTGAGLPGLAKKHRRRKLIGPVGQPLDKKRPIQGGYKGFWDKSLDFMRTEALVAIDPTVCPRRVDPGTFTPSPSQNRT